jgi:hypothetical protein
MDQTEKTTLYAVKKGTHFFYWRGEGWPGWASDPTGAKLFSTKNVAEFIANKHGGNVICVVFEE